MQTTTTTHKVNDLVLVDVNGQYEFARVYYTSDTGYISLETISGGYMGGPVDAHTIIPATASVPGYAAAMEWLADLIA